MNTDYRRILMHDLQSMIGEKQEKWDALFRDGARYRELNEVFILDLLDVFATITGTQPSSVLDLGCGSGNALAKFASLGLPVTGVDISGVAIGQAQERLKGAGYEAKFIQHDLDEISTLRIKAPKGTLWICKLVLAFVSNQQEFLRSVKNLMGGGDVLAVMTPVLRDGVVYAKEDRPGIAIPIVEVERMLTDVFGSFKVFSNEYHGDRGRVVTYLMKKE